MANFIRFKAVEIASRITFKGDTRKKLKYPVRSIALLPMLKSTKILHNGLFLPEIFW